MSVTAKKIHHLQVALFSLTLLVSAALMFSLQPMVGKMLLPIVGGAPSGWIVAMAFFQVMLLAGYFLAHALSRFTPQVQGIIYILCLCFGMIFLPIALSSHTGLLSATPMAFDVFLLLSIVVAVPFIALSATASTLQRLFTSTGHASSEDPYFLYAASNLGSLGGLLLYPLYIESHSTLTAQSQAWKFGYILLIVLAAACLFFSRHKNGMAAKKARQKSASAGWKLRLGWMLLAFMPSGLLLAVTTHITTDILSVPLLWVLPLGLYLITFIIAFSGKKFVDYTHLQTFQPLAVAIAVTISLTVMATLSVAPSWYALGIHLICFSAVALMCHMRLARLRPADASAQLTDFYLMIALGGAAGGIAAAFVAPALFNSPAEYPLLMIVSCLLNENIRSKFTNDHRQTFVAGAATLLVTICLQSLGLLPEAGRNIFLMLSFILLAHHPRMALIGGMLALIGVSVYIWQQYAVLSTRNFYGVLRVYDKKETVLGKTFSVRYMQHGTTLHGFQVMDDAYETTPTAYYSRKGPLGDVFGLLRPKSVAVIGLGTGTINCYATPDRKMTFFEINPAVIDIARKYFTFLSNCGSQAPEVIPGDARLVLNDLQDRKFDLIILDAFSSDMIPTHLVTKEAIEIYLQRLTPRGALLFHISNRYFKLEDPLMASAAAFNLESLHVLRQKDGDFYATASHWLIMARPEAKISPLSKAGWQAADPERKTELWTDDYTDLMSVLNF